MPPIGACSVASNTLHAGFDVQLLDLLFSETPATDVVDMVQRFKPDLIGVSIRNIDNLDQQSSRFYLDEVKREVIDPLKRSTITPLVIGGAAVNIMPDRIMNYLGVDFAISGEGEHVLAQFAQHLEEKLDLDTIKGLWYRKNDQIQGSSVKRISTLAQLHWPKVYKWVDWPRYQLNYSTYPIQTKRGCGLQCSYCVYNTIEGSQYRLREPEDIVDEIEDIVINCNPSCIEFTDSTFNIPLHHALQICEEIIRRGVKTSFNTMGMNPGSITEELVSLMKEAGFIEVSCTPESGSEKILKSLGKNFTLHDVQRAATILKKSNMPVSWYFLFGGPGENKSTIRETFNFIENNISKTDLVFITSGIRLFPGAPLYKHQNESSGIPKKDPLQPFWFEPDEIHADEMAYMINKEVITHQNYLNLQDNTDDSLLAQLVKRAYGFFRIREPLWTNVIRRDKLYNLFGYNKYRLWNLEKKHKSSLLA